MTYQWPAPAKINLFLSIIGRRSDGYHFLQTLFQFLDYGDTLTITPTSGGRIRLLTPVAGVAAEDNLIVHAARRLQHYCWAPDDPRAPGADILIKKVLPIGGGLGGGSSNAATILVALNAQWDCCLDLDTLAQLGLTLGADVPIFVHGKAAFAEGIGEKLTPVEPAEKWYLIAVPPIMVATQRIFSDPELKRDSLPRSLTQLLSVPFRNDCEPIVRKHFFTVEQHLAWLLEYAPARLTGTGACVFAEFDTEAAVRHVLSQYPTWMHGFVARGVNVSPLHRALSGWRNTVSRRKPEVIFVPDMKLFAGNATPKLAQSIANCLYTSLGNAAVGRFSDGEVSVQINENVRGGDIFIIQSTCAPTNDNLIELVVMVDALRRASAGRITAVIPYFGYARQDRRVRSARVPITAKVVADFLSSVGVDRVLTVDLHAEQIQGFFDVPVDNVFGSPILLEDMLQQDLENPIVVSPDIGGVARARAIAKLLNDTDMAIIDKRRPRANVLQVMHIIGDVAGRDCVLVDDMIDTGGTLCKAAEALKERGAKRVFAYATHPIFSGNAYENIKDSVIDEMIVCDTIPLDPVIKTLSNVRTLTLSIMLAETIRRISNEESISAMFDH